MDPRDFTCGIEFANDPQIVGGSNPDFGPAECAGMARAVKFSNVWWQHLEPGAFPPSVSDALRFNWPWLDEQVNAWWDAGFTEIGFVVATGHHSFYTAPTYTAPDGFPASAVSSYPPKNASAYSAYARLIDRLVTRYAGKLKWIEIESEWQSPSWFEGGIDDYLEMLHTARSAVAASANPSVKVCLGGHTFDDLLDDDPDDATIEARLASRPEPFQTIARRAIELGQLGLQDGDYDIVEIHSLSAPSGIGPAVRRSRVYMPAESTAEIWIGDAFPGMVVLYNDLRFNNPAPEDAMNGAYAQLASGNPNAVAKFLAGQVRTTREKIAAAIAAGCSRMHLGPIFDWPITTGYPFQGLFDAAGRRRPVCQVIQSWAMQHRNPSYGSFIALSGR